MVLSDFVGMREGFSRLNYRYRRKCASRCIYACILIIESLKMIESLKIITAAPDYRGQLCGISTSISFLTDVSNRAIGFVLESTPGIRCMEFSNQCKASGSQMCRQRKGHAECSQCSIKMRCLIVSHFRLDAPFPWTPRRRAMWLGSMILFVWFDQCYSNSIRDMDACTASSRSILQWDAIDFDGLNPLRHKRTLWQTPS